MIEDGRALTPQLKQELALLINDGKDLAAVLGPVITTGGTAITLDIAAIEPAIKTITKLTQDFVGFLPTLDAAAKQIGADLA